MAREAEAKAQMEEAARAKRAEGARKAAEKEAKAKVSPQDLFRGGEYANQFGAYGDDGVPTVRESPTVATVVVAQTRDGGRGGLQSGLWAA